MVESVRAFVAIELSSEMREALGELIARLKGTGLSGVRWVNPEAVHLTLKFLGNVPRAQVGEITTAASPFLYSPQVFPTAVGLIGFSKVLMASDFPLLRQNHLISQVRDSSMSQEAKDAILGGNATRLLGLSSEG